MPTHPSPCSPRTGPRGAPEVQRQQRRAAREAAGQRDRAGVADGINPARRQKDWEGYLAVARLRDAQGPKQGGRTGWGREGMIGEGFEV